MDLLEPEKKLLSQYKNALLFLLKINQSELTFSDFQVFLSDSGKPLAAPVTASILGVLQRYGAVQVKERSYIKPYRLFILNKEKLKEVINELE